MKRTFQIAVPAQPKFYVENTQHSVEVADGHNFYPTKFKKDGVYGVGFVPAYRDALAACAGEYPNADKYGNPENVCRGKLSNSTDSVRHPNRAAIYALIEAHPQFSDLKKMVDRHIKSIYGPHGTSAAEALARETPETYLSDIVMNAKSSAQKNRDRIQLAIFQESGIPREKPGLFRGHKIDWHKVAVDRAVIQGKVVSSEVLDCFYPAS